MSKAVFTRSVAASVFALSVLALSGSGRTRAQTTPSPAIDSAKRDYADEPVVIEHQSTVISSEADGTGWIERSLVVRVQSDGALKQYGVVIIPYASKSEHVEILYARVHHPDGTTVATDTTDALEVPTPVTQMAPFYSDQRQLQLPIRSLRVGDTVEWKARTTRTIAVAPGQFWGAETSIENAVVLDQTLELRVPAGLYVNVWSRAGKAAESTVPRLPSTGPKADPPSGVTPGATEQHLYRWTFRQLKPTVGKEAEAAVAEKKKIPWTAEQELDAEQGRLPTVAWSTFKSWEQVGDWYRGLEADRIVPDETVRAKAAEITAGKSSDEEKARALYSYVATNIRYIGVAFGIGRYQPHSASEILANQYGDCKDKHTLLAAMLESVGLHADAVLIGAGLRFNEAVPSPAPFNHLITRLSLPAAQGQPEQVVWLDSTSEVAPWTMLSSTIRDRPALVVVSAPAKGGVNAFIARTPVTLPFPDSVTIESSGSLDSDGVASTHMVLTMRGDAELLLRTVFRQLPASKYDEMVQQFSKGLGFPGTTNHAEVSSPSDTSKPFTIAYDYKTEKAGDWEHLRTVAQIAPVLLPRVAAIDPPNHDIQLGQPRTLTSHALMKLPDGWRAIVPPALHVKCAYGTYDVAYRFENGTVYADRTLEILAKKVPLRDWQAYMEWSNAIHPGQERYVQLLRAGDAGIRQGSWAVNSGPGAATQSGRTPQNWLQIRPGGGSNYIFVPAPLQAGAIQGDAKADGLIRSAYDSFDRHELDSAQLVLDEAKALNPQQVGLWSTYALLELRRGNDSGVISNLQKELQLHPEQTNLYILLEGEQRKLNRRADRISTLRAWSGARPTDPYPITQLMRMLVEDGDAGAAVKEASNVPLSSPVRKDHSFQIQLGRALLQSGNTTAGSDTLLELLKQIEDAGSRNTIAYALAQAGVQLQASEAAARAAVGQLVEQSKTSTLRDDPQVLRARWLALRSAWDTLGYVLFREGKLDEAATYARAAWLSNPSDDLGQHLGDIVAAQGDKAAALKVYQLALATIPGANASAGYAKSLRERIAALAPDAAETFSANSAADLAELRTIHLGPAPPSLSLETSTVSAQYRILMKRGKAVDVQPLSDASVPGIDASLANADFSRLVPKGCDAVLARTGSVSCRTDGCVVLLDPGK